MLRQRLRSGVIAWTTSLVVAVTLSAPFGAVDAASQGRTARRDSGRAEVNRPKLVVLIVVDQFRYDYLERFRNLFSTGGFRLLMDRGAFFVNANYDYVPTYTAPGHAAIATGSVPALDGIVGNEWYDRASGRVRVMVSDDSAHLVLSPGLSGGGSDPATAGPSPRNLIGTTLGDQLRLSNNFQSKVVAVSLKDRAAILPGGQRPNGAYWFDGRTGSFVTSDYYTSELPEWVNTFNHDQRPDKYFGAKWDLSLNKSAYRISQSEMIASQGSALGKSFPFTVTGGESKPGPKFYTAFEFTPFASEYLEEFAKQAVQSEDLGEDNYPDLLSISFSSPDLIGHSYGPDSPEIEDTYIRLDRVLADLFSFLDRKIGLNNTVIAITGDHGVSPVPEYLKAKGLAASRISGKACVDAVEKALTERFGGKHWVLSFVNDQLYLDRAQMASLKVDPGEVERVAGAAALTVDGIENFFTSEQIIGGQLPPGPIARRVANGFNRKRSGDVWIITRPFSFFAEGPFATTHGSPYNYDTHVPVILMGGKVKAGRYYQQCSPSDIAPTIAALLGVEQPSNRVGRVLVEALEK